MTRTLFTNARIFDGTSAAIADGEIVVEDGLIVDVGSGLDGDEAIDLGGRTLLPGFFDCHVHVVFSDVNVWAAAQRAFSYNFYIAEKNLKATLEAGVTTVRDAGGADLGIREALEDGLIAGPRMQISLTMLSRTGGHGDGWMASGMTFGLENGYPGMPTGVVDGPDEMRKKVREVVRAGADVIKVATSGGVMSPRSEPSHPHLAVDELEVLVSEANDVDRFVMAHAQASEGIKRAVRAGIRSIEHGIFLDDEAIGLMLEHGTWLVPTLVAPDGVLRAAAAGMAISDASLRKAREVMEIHRHSFARAVAAGVKIAMGTDSGVTPHGENLDELRLMEAGGMSPHDVLVATTQSAAELLGVLDDSGTIEAGKRADLVVLDGDPYEFEGMKDRIVAVYQAGELVVGGI